MLQVPQLQCLADEDRAALVHQLHVSIDAAQALADAIVSSPDRWDVHDQREAELRDTMLTLVGAIGLYQARRGCWGRG